MFFYDEGRADGVLLFFFFQAEDGIRDLYVTGVQTCALPISPAAQPARDEAFPSRDEALPSRDEALPSRDEALPSRRAPPAGPFAVAAAARVRMSSRWSTARGSGGWP